MGGASSSPYIYFWNSSYVIIQVIGIHNSKNSIGLWSLRYPTQKWFPIRNFTSQTIGLLYQSPNVNEETKCYMGSKQRGMCVAMFHISMDASMLYCISGKSIMHPVKSCLFCKRWGYFWSENYCNTITHRKMPKLVHNV